MNFCMKVTGPNDRSISRETIRVSSEHEIWQHVVRRARRWNGAAGIQIRVVDENDGILVLTSASAALLVSQEAA